MRLDIPGSSDINENFNKTTKVKDESKKKDTPIPEFYFKLDKF
jgi:hypothetical protein